MPDGRKETATKPTHKRCWCWQYGRCLVDCPTADLPRPKPLTDANWRKAWRQVKAGPYPAQNGSSVYSGNPRPVSS